MWKRPVAIVLMFTALFLWGCPYESVVPIDDPSIPIDRGLFGKWQRTGEEKSYASLSKLSRTDSASYQLVYNSWTTEHRSYDVKIFKAWLSRVNETWFINIQPQMKSVGNFYLCAFQCNNTQDTIRLRPILEEGSPKFSKSEDLKKWILQKMGNRDFFDSEESFVRVK
jgi:hypothetical protein